MKSESEMTILVIDDEQNIREGSERILSRMGYRVLTAANGQQGLALVQAQPVAIVLLDLKMPGMDGMEVLTHIRLFDPEILVIVITGYATIETAIEAMKKGAYDFIPKPFEPDQLRIVINRARERLRLIDETRRLEKERERNLADLGTEKSRIRTIVETLPNGVLVTNVEGRIALMNPAFRWLMEIEGEVPAGAPVESCIAEAGLLQLIREVSKGKERNGTVDAKYEFAVGEQKFLQAIAKPVWSESGECVGAVVNLTDITTMKLLDRLKNEFVAKVSHELRSPLSTIHEQLALVLRDMAEKESSRDQYLLSRAKEKTQGLISLIGDLLDLSHIEAGNVCKDRKPIHLAELLKNIVDFLGTKAKAKRQRLDLELPPEPLPLIEADPMAIESIFGNLITNAIHYTQEEGKILVRVSQEPAAEVATPTSGTTANIPSPTPAPSSWIRVDVIDNGFGIEERHLENIFKRFYRVKNEKTRFITGTGLGLPIVKGLLDELGGRITVQSVPDHGSTFTVLLPVCTQ